MLVDFIIFAAYGADFMQFGPYTRPAEPNRPPGSWFQPPPPIRQDKNGGLDFLLFKLSKILGPSGLVS